MIINHNLMALNTWRQLNINDTATQNVLQQLSSGYRINRAGDDAAGLAISEKMRGQISGLDQASRNAQDGISLIQTAEGALNETHSILQRMRELAVQASNDTNTADDRNALQQEVAQLQSEINRISNTTQFNTKNLLDGSIGVTATVLSGDNLKLKTVNVVDANVAADTYTVKVQNAAPSTSQVSTTGTPGITTGDFDLANTSGLASGQYTLSVTANGTNWDVALKDSGGTTVASVTAWDGASAVNLTGNGVTFALKAPTGTVGAGTLTFNYNDGKPALNATVTTNTTGLSASNFDLTSGNISGLALGNYTLNVQANAAGTFDVSLQDQNGVTVASANGWDGASTVTLQGSVNGIATKFTIMAPTPGTVQGGTMAFNLNATYGAGSFSITGSNGNTVYSNAGPLTITDSNFQAGGFQFNMTADTVLAGANQSTVTVSNKALTMHIGANQNQVMKVAVNQMDTKSLGIDNIDLTSQTGAEAAITAIDGAIGKVSTERAKLGAYQNRLEHTINNLGTASENLTAAESRIRDVDMAQAMMEFTKDNILKQASTAMLAQANQQPQLVLQLLR